MTNLWGQQNKSTLLVRVTAGEYSAEFEGESGSKGLMTGYGAAAGKVVQQLEAWVDANRSKLADFQTASGRPVIQSSR